VNYRLAEQGETQSSVKTSRENLSDGNAESKLLRDLGGINESKNLVFFTINISRG
jgi:hypothetical protein